MFDLFSERAKSVFDSARTQAKVNQNDEIAPEHVLLAVLGDDTSAGSQVLTELCKVNPDKLRDALRKSIDLLPKVKPNGEPKYSSGTKAAMDGAMAIAQEAGDEAIGTEHLLVGLMMDEKNSLDRVLTQIGLDRKTVKEKVFEFLASVQQQGPAIRARQDMGLLVMIDERLSPEGIAQLAACIGQFRGVATVEPLRFKTKAAGAAPASPIHAVQGGRIITG